MFAELTGTFGTEASSFLARRFAVFFFMNVEHIVFFTKTFLLDFVKRFGFVEFVTNTVAAALKVTDFRLASIP